MHCNLRRPTSRQSVILRLKLNSCHTTMMRLASLPAWLIILKSKVKK